MARWAAIDRSNSLCERSHTMSIEPETMVRIAAIGDNDVDCYKALGQMFPGGNCVNVSVFARRAGAEAAYVGAVGLDRAGDAIADALLKEGVDITRLRRVEGSTAWCMISHRDGDRVFESWDLGVSIFAPDGHDIAFLRGFDAAHVGQSSHLDDFLPEIAAATKLSYDFSTRRDAAHRRAIGARCFLASISASDLTDREIEAAVGDLRQAGAQWILVTRGRNGALLFHGDKRFRVSAALVDPIDTLGAGDAFIARTLVGLLRNETPDQLLEAAALQAAETCLAFGAIGHPSAIGLPASAERA